jgi:LysM repeat protein
MSGRHRRQTSRGGLGAAAIATSGAFAIVPMVMATGTASADTPNPNPVPAPRHASPEENTADTTAISSPSTYTVKAGDTLSAIAAGRGTNWQAVWAANKTSIPDANMLHPGEQIELPTSALHAAPASTSTVANTAAPATLHTRSGPMIGRAPSAVSAVTKAAAKAPAARPKKIAAALKPGGAVDVTPTGATKQFKIWLTGYSYQDNTPAGSATVSHPILHKVAGGTGTYADPITVAVPGQGSGIWKAGSRFYLPSVKRYVIVEDTGASPAPSGDAGHLDMWVDGQGGSKSESDKCMNQITTQSAAAIYSPPSSLPVIPGPITQNGKCNIPT